MRISERVRRDLADHTRFGDLRLFDELDSTNRWVRDAAMAGAGEGLVAVADHQSAGRGRLGRTWDAPAGSGLLVSVLLRPVGLGPDRLHLITAAAGLAAAVAVRRTCGVDPELKWPNDLIVENRKLAGVLAEVIAPPGTPGARPDDHDGWAVVVGIGINVSGAAAGGVALAEVAGRPVAGEDVLVALLEELEARYGRWDEVAAGYHARCGTVGRRVRVEAHDGTSRLGEAVRVDDAGRLVVVFDDPEGGSEGSGSGEVTIDAADVTHLRTTS